VQRRFRLSFLCSPLCLCACYSHVSLLLSFRVASLGSHRLYSGLFVYCVVRLLRFCLSISLPSCFVGHLALLVVHFVDVRGCSCGGFGRVSISYLFFRLLPERGEEGEYRKRRTPNSHGCLPSPRLDLFVALPPHIYIFPRCFFSPDSLSEALIYCRASYFLLLWLLSPINTLWVSTQHSLLLPI